MPIRQVEIALEMPDRKTRPSPSRANDSPPEAPPRLTRVTPAMPTTQPRTLLALSRSVWKTSAASRMHMKVELDSMIELAMPVALDSPM